MLGGRETLDDVVAGMTALAFCKKPSWVAAGPSECTVATSTGLIEAGPVRFPAAHV